MAYHRPINPRLHSVGHYHIDSGRIHFVYQFLQCKPVELLSILGLLRQSFYRTWSCCVKAYSRLIISRLFNIEHHNNKTKAYPWGLSRLIPIIQYFIEKGLSKPIVGLSIQEYPIRVIESALHKCVCHHDMSNDNLGFSW